MNLQSIKLNKAFWFQEGPGVRKWQFTDQGVKLLNVANILKTGIIDLSKTDRHLAIEEVESKYSHFLADDGDLVIASSGISIDDDGFLKTRGAFIENKHLPLCMNTSTIRFKTIDGISDLCFLKHWLQSFEFRSQITREVTGIAQKNFGPSHLKRLSISLPSLPEQKRIAAILDAADALRAKRRESLDQLDALLKSTFLDMFGDPVTNPKDWKTVPFNKIGKFVSGSTPSKAREDFWNGSVPWVSPKDMKVARIFDSQDHISDQALKETNIKLLAPGYLLIVVRGMILAHSFPIATNNVPVTINQDMKGIYPSPLSEVNFLLECIRLSKRQILFEVSTAGHGTRRFDAEAMKKIMIPLPPLTHQHRFEKIAESIENQKSRLRAHLAELDTLFASLQSRAFKGEL